MNTLSKFALATGATVLAMAVATDLIMAARADHNADQYYLATAVYNSEGKAVLSKTFGMRGYDTLQECSDRATYLGEYLNRTTPDMPFIAACIHPRTNTLEVSIQYLLDMLENYFPQTPIGYKI